MCLCLHTFAKGCPSFLFQQQISFLHRIPFIKALKKKIGTMDIIHNWFHAIPCHNFPVRPWLMEPMSYDRHLSKLPSYARLCSFQPAHPFTKALLQFLWMKQSMNGGWAVIEGSTPSIHKTHFIHTSCSRAFMNGGVGEKGWA